MNRPCTIAATAFFLLFPGGVLRAAKFPITSFRNLEGVIVRDIFQDSHGLLWLATDSGVWRWSAGEFRSFSKQLPEAPVTALAEDKHEMLWFGTMNGLVPVDLNAGRATAHPRLLPGIRVNRILRDADGVVWIGTYKGLYRLHRDGEAYRAEIVRGTEAFRIRAMAITDRGLWAGGDEILLHIDGNRVEARHRALTKGRNIVALESAPDGALWIGTRNGDGLFHLLGGVVTRLPIGNGLLDDRVNTMARGVGRDLWIGTEAGVFRWDGETFLALDHRAGLTNPDVHSLRVDREKHLWIGTFGGGVNRLRAVHTLCYGMEDGLPHPLVTAAARAPDGRLLLGTVGGAAWFDTRGAEFERIAPVFHVDGVFVASDGVGWLAGPVGFAQVGAARVDPSVGGVDALGEDGEGHILVGSARGLYRHEAGRLSRIRLPESVESGVHAIKGGIGGHTYVGTARGLARSRGDGWETLLTDRDVRAIEDAGDGRLWLVVEDQVVSWDGQTLHEKIPPSLLGSRIRDVRMDEAGTLWVATADGLLRRQRSVWERFSFQHGLPSRDTRFVLPVSKEILLAGTTRGLAWIDSRRLAHCDVPPILVMQELLMAKGGAERSSNPPHLMVAVSCLGWSSADGARFQYRLVGRDENWSAPTTQRTHSLHSLRSLTPGAYTFEARAVNAHGLISNIERIPLFVAGPMRHQPWFVFTMVAVTTAFAVLTVRRYRRRMLLYRTAVAAVRAKREFLSRMSHEIRTPLTAILASAERLTLGELAEERAECVATIRRNGRHLLDVVNDFLDVSKVRNGKMQFHPETVSLGDLIVGVESTSIDAAKAKGVDLTTEIGPDVPAHIVTDAPKLRQLLINLLSNAVKFTDEGSVRLRVSSQARDGRRMLRFTVTDTGIGIAADQLPAIFEAFQQADTSKRRRYSGTGLGLTIAKALAELLGGALRASSELGRGSTFTADIPLVPGVTSGMDSRANRAQAESEHVEGCLRPCRLLVADDCQDILRVVSVVLEDAGASVKRASGGSDVITFAMEERFDAIILDIHMPDLDGVRVAHRLRRAGVTTPLVALTADATAQTRRRCLNAGFTECIIKPFDHAGLIDAILTSAQGAGDGGVPQSVAKRMTRDGVRERASDGREADRPIRAELLASSLALAKVSREFAGSLGEDIQHLEAAIARRDIDRLEEIAHRLKGAGGINGYMCITERAEALERSVKERSFQAAAAHIASMELLRQRIALGLAEHDADAAELGDRDRSIAERTGS